MFWILLIEKKFINSWTTVDPSSIPNPRNGLGLPSKNSGRFVIEGRLKDIKDIKSHEAYSADGNEGGLPEFEIPSPEMQIKIERVSGANPEY